MIIQVDLHPPTHPPTSKFCLLYFYINKVSKEKLFCCIIVTVFFIVFCIFQFPPELLRLCHTNGVDLGADPGGRVLAADLGVVAVFRRHSSQPKWQHRMLGRLQPTRRMATVLLVCISLKNEQLKIRPKKL